MKRWAIHNSDGTFIGYVDAKTEDEARCAAIATFDSKLTDDFSALEK